MPRRSASGHRRYGCDQVEVLRLVAARTRGGDAIGELMTAYRAGTLRTPPGPDPEPSRPATTGSSRDEFLPALFACDLDAAEACFTRLAHALPTAALVTQVIEPALVEAGERWFRHESKVFHEHFATGFLRRKLAQLIDAARPATGTPERMIAIGTAQGDRHEGGVLLLAFSLRNAGWRVVNLGVDLPTEEYDKAVRRLRPDALGLSFVLSRNINKRFNELARIEDVPVFVGGRSILNYQALARRHGLIPIPGPASQASEQLAHEFADWEARRRRDVT